MNYAQTLEALEAQQQAVTTLLTGTNDVMAYILEQHASGNSNPALREIYNMLHSTLNNVDAIINPVVEGEEYECDIVTDLKQD